MITPAYLRTVALGIAALGALMAPTVLVAVERVADEITVRCDVDRLAIGAGGVTTWTLLDDPSDYRPEDIVLTQDHIDRMRPCWAPAGDDGRTPLESGARPVVPTRQVRMHDDAVLDYPVEIILPGWAALAEPAAPTPGGLLVWWRLGGGWHTSAVALTLTTSSASPATAPVPVPLVAPIAYALDATFDPQEAVALSGDLVARVTRIAVRYDRPEIWRSAVIEWTRLPNGAKTPTTVYSPFQAGVKGVEPLTTVAAVAAVATTLPHDVRFRVSEALRDPRTGMTPPGRYRIRLAMGWQAADPESSAHPVLVTIRSLPQIIRVLAEGEPMPPRCPICNARLDAPGAGTDGRQR
jgi:hypothetical protein